MRVVSCPNCRVELDLDDEDAGHLVECPACLTKFTAPADGVPKPPPIPVLKKATDPDTPPAARSRWREADDRASRRGRSDTDDGGHYDRPKDVVYRAQRRLATAGGGLQVLGWIDVTAGVIGLILGLLIIAGSISSGGKEWEFGLANAGPGLSGIVLGGVKAFGGAAMKHARNRTLSVLAAVAGCIPLNISCCLSFLLFPAYIVSMVFGIMALAVLFNKDVKKAFEITRPDGDADVM
jgi:hypothetical protein